MTTLINREGIKPFNGENYSSWKLRMRILLIREGLWNNVVDPIPSTRNRTNEWTEADQKAVQWIVANIEDNMLDIIHNKTHAKQIWDALCETFESRSDLRILDKKDELSSMKFQGGDMRNYILSYRAVVNQLKELNDPTSNRQHILKLLRTLPAEYVQIRLAIEMTNPEQPLEWEDVTKKLVDFSNSLQLNHTTSSVKETKIENSDASSSNQINAFNSFSGRKNFRRAEQKSDQHSNSGNFDSSRNKFNRNYNSNSNSGNFDSSRNKKFNRNYSSNIKCNYCHGSGHTKINCFKLQKKNNSRNLVSNVAQSEFALIGFESSVASHVGDRLIGALDSGATRHMVNVDTILSEVTTFDEPVPIKVAKNNISMNATKKGKIFVSNNGRTGVLENVYYVPELSRNLFSVRAIERDGFVITFKNGKVFISKNGRLVAEGVAKDDLYIISFDVLHVSESASLAISDGQLWHKRFAHPGINEMRQLAKVGIFDPKIIDSENCDSCEVSKHCRNSRSTITDPCRQAQGLLERVHSDVCEITNSPCAERYFVTFIDEFSGFTSVYVLKNKSEVFDKFRSFVLSVENLLNKRIKRLRCDNGGEYSSNQFKSFCEDRGIFIEYTTAYSPESNGKSERLNRTLCERMRAVLSDSHLGHKFWPYALLYVVYSWNRIPKFDQVPAYLWYGKPPNYLKMKPFGCVAFLHVNSVHRNSKLDSTGKKCCFIGYSANGYFVYDFNLKEVVNSRDITFKEDRMYMNEHVVGPISSSVPILPSDNYIPTSSSENTVSNPSVSNNTAYSRPKRSINMPSRYDDYELNLCALLSYQDVISSPESKLWSNAITREFDSMERLKVWQVVQKPANVSLLDTTWVFKRKASDIFRARLVAKGYQQQPGIDFKDIHSPVARLVTIRVLFSFIVRHGWFMKHVDINTAFLHGTLDEEIYIAIPEGHRLYGTSNSSDLCLRLLKAMYGLKQASRQWYIELRKFFESIGMQFSEADFCLYYGLGVIVIIFVDDMVIASSSEHHIDRFISSLKSRFELSDLGPVSNFLNMNIQYDRKNRELFIDQTELIAKVLSVYGMNDCNAVRYPIENRLYSVLEGSTRPILKDNSYKALLGHMMYIMLGSRPDLCYSISLFSRFQDRATADHYTYLLNVLRYLKGTMDKKLKFDSSDNTIVSAYCDADFANESDRKSLSGNLVKFFGNIVHWSSKKQSLVTLSSTEAEYVSLCSITTEVVWMSKLISCFDICLNSPIPIYVDNSSTVCLVKNFRNNRRVKHLDIRYYFVQQYVDSKLISLERIDTNSQQADGLTKGLIGKKFLNFINFIRLV